MSKLFGQPWFPTVMNTLIILGIIVAIGAGIFWVIANQQLQENPAYQIQQSGGEVSVESEAEAQGLLAAELQKNQLMNQQNMALIIGGSGLVLVGVFWLLRDFAKSKYPAKPEAG